MATKDLHLSRHTLEQWARAEESDRAAHDAIMKLHYTCHRVHDEYIFEVPADGPDLFEYHLVQLYLELLHKDALRAYMGGPRGTVQDIGYIPPVLRMA